jgi:MFS family permease
MNEKEQHSLRKYGRQSNQSDNMTGTISTLEKNINRLYLIHIFGSAQFHLVVYTLFLLSKGFTTQQFFLIESAYYLISLLLEIPTGVFSDRISRKWSLVIASVIGIPIIPVIVFSDSFIIVLLAMSVGGMGSALTSGTDTAILYDTLKALDHEEEFQQVAGKMGWYGSLSMALAGIIGGLLATLDMAYAWWAYFVAGLLATAVKFTLLEPPFFRTNQKEESYLQHLGQSWRISTRGAAGFFVFYAATIWFFFSIGFWLWQPYLELSAVPLAWFGFIYAIQNVLGGFSAKQAHRIERKIGTRNALLVIPLGLAVVFILESQFVFALGFIFIFMHSLFSGPFHPLLEDYINKRIPSSKRATVLSIKNMVNSLLFMMVSPLIGYFIDFYSLTAALLLMGLMLVVISLVFFYIYQNKTEAVPLAV